MRIRSLLLDNFGPFRRYTITFVPEDSACVLLTGRNNEGKSNILLALKLLSSACRVVGRRQTQIIIDGDQYFRLPQLDVSHLTIGRLLHNYSGEHAIITAEFDDGLVITVHLDELKDMIYADYRGRIPKDLPTVFGFIPPLGPLSEFEELLSRKYVQASINSSLAPRHLRNHLYQVLSDEEYALVQDIINATWPSIQLLDCTHRHGDNLLTCFFVEGRIERELAWAGQGLQVWFQIIAHLVRLRDTAILVLDEPEVNLHAEKQNDLIRVLRDYHGGSVIIATHSSELMNNVDVSHIIHVQKSHARPQIKATTDRAYLNVVRSQIGSCFNLIASQFESCDRIVFTEDVFDFVLLRKFAEAYGFTGNVFNIPLHGFSEYPKALSYRDAYRLLIGRDTPHAVLLDRDYYPENHLESVRERLTSGGLITLFTPGKEIENLLLSPAVVNEVIRYEDRDAFAEFWDDVFDKERLDCYGSYLTLHGQFLPKRLDTKTLTKEFTPVFDVRWADKDTRHLIIGGKKALQHLRMFYRSKTGQNLTTEMLIEAAVRTNDLDTRNTVAQILGEAEPTRQILHY
ncbi:MAG: AAA family ATPase [Candidatus Competibacter sp.]|nr:AAA family ATPase [Candidatus Competibacter sp.]